VKKSPGSMEWSLPVVAETWDGYLNDVNGFHVQESDVVAALESARGGPVAEGNVGGGTGMVCYGFKGGIGTASRRFGDYTVGEKIDHVDGVTVEEAEHQIATRLYQNTARVHFNQFAESKGRFGRRLIYGGHVISLARSLSFNGLGNAFQVAAINGGRHVAPLFAGCTVFAWSEILACADVPGREDVGVLRVRTIATKDRPCSDFPFKNDRDYDPAVILDLDYWVLLPR